MYLAHIGQTPCAKLHSSHSVAIVMSVLPTIPSYAPLYDFVSSEIGESRMSKAIENLNRAMERAAVIRPRVGGFPYLAETLRQAGITRNVWSLPACQSLFLTNDGPVVVQGTPLVSGSADVPAFNREALITALRVDQAGESTFPQFLAASWRAGVVRYDVDFARRTVAYIGCNGEEYIEAYPAVEIG